MKVTTFYFAVESHQCQGWTKGKSPIMFNFLINFKYPELTNSTNPWSIFLVLSLNNGLSLVHWFLWQLWFHKSSWFSAHELGPRSMRISFGLFLDR